MTAYYDKVKRKPAQKSRYLGQFDPLTGMITKPEKIKTKKEKMILDFGDSFFVMKFMEKHMEDVYAFAKDNGALPLILYRILRKASMRRAEIWYEGNIARYIAPGDLRSQRISEFLVKLGDESVIMDFYKKYLNPLNQVYPLTLQLYRTRSIWNQDSWDILPIRWKRRSGYY